MKVGFTGTRDGLFPDQRSQLWSWIVRNPITEFHHGCCIGADFEAAEIVGRAKDVGTVAFHAHPSTLAGLTSDKAVRRSNVVHPTKAPLERNHDIVDACEVLLACPKGPEERRSGTWATVRYAQKVKRHVIIFWPNGEVTEE